MSPIEEMMLEQFAAWSAEDSEAKNDHLARSDRVRAMLAARGFDLDAPHLAVDISWHCYQEAPVGPYRLDFALVGDSGLVCVECDGHDYHERTAAQAEHDRKRDRWLQRRGWHVMRFTGREIVRSAGACLDEIRDLLSSLDLIFVDAWEHEKRIREGRE